MSWSIPALKPARHASVAFLHQFAAPCHLYIEICDFLAQGIAVDAQQIGTFGLIPAGCVEVFATREEALAAADPASKRHAARVVGPSKSSEGQYIYYLLDWL